jgi:hypothetical protein
MDHELAPTVTDDAVWSVIRHPAMASGSRRSASRRARTTRQMSWPCQPADLTREVESQTAGLVRVVHGEGRTDFVPIGVNTGTGLRALADRLGGRVALAVGDSAEDLTMFAEAVITHAPRNADDAVRAAGIRGPAAPTRTGSPTRVPTCSATVLAAAPTVGNRRCQRGPPSCVRCSACARTVCPVSHPAPPA